MSDAHGGTGNYQSIGDCIAWMREIDPRRVLDVGVGFGRWGFLVRDFLEVWNGRNSRADWKIRLTGVEAFAGNIREHHRLFYDELLVTPVQDHFARSRESHDLVILGDVLEHLTPTEGRELLRTALRRSGYVLLVLPIGDQWPQGDAYGNSFERHLATWNEADLAGFSPLLMVRYLDYVDRPFVAGVLSLKDPKALASRLERVTSAPQHRWVRFEREAREESVETTVEVAQVAWSDGGQDRLHLALVTREYPPFYGGGISTYARHVTRLLSEAGHRVTVFTEDRGEAPPEQPNVTVLRWPMEGDSPTGSGVMDWLGENMRWGRWLSAALAEVHAQTPLDAIEVTDFYLEDLFLDVSALETDGRPVPLVTHFHSPRSMIVGLDGLRNAPLLTKLENALLTAAPFRKTYSPRMATQVDELWPGARCEFVPAAFFPPAHLLRAEDLPPRAQTDLVYFGRLQKLKGLDRLTEALRFAAGRGLAPSVTLVGRDTNTAPGEQSMSRWLEQMLRPVLGQQLRLIESMPPNALWSVLRHARLVVLPSLWESLGFTVLEAFCSGSPALCSHLAGASYVLSGELMNKTLVDVRETERFAERIEWALGLSDAERGDWAMALRETVVRHFAAERVMPRVAGYYQRCVERAGEAMSAARRDAAVRQRILAIIDDIVRIAHARRGDMDRLEGELEQLRAGAAAGTRAAARV